MLTDVVVKWAGSTHDTAIYNLSGVKDLVDKYLDSSGCDGWLIAQWSGRPCEVDIGMTKGYDIP